MQATKLLVLMKSVDGGTGTYLEGLRQLTDLGHNHELKIKVLSLERPRFRSVRKNEYVFFTTSNQTQEMYRPTFSTLRRFYRELSWLRSHIRSFSPHVIVSQDPHSILLAELGRFFFGLSFVSIVSLHNNLRKVIELRVPAYLRKLFYIVFGFFVRRANQVVTVSKKLSRDIQKDLHLKSVPKTIQFILPKRVVGKKDTQTFHKKIVVSIARMDVQKDHKSLVDAFALVVRKLPEAQLWLVGNGPLYGWLVRYVAMRKLTDKVRFLGWTQDPLRVLQQSSVFVLSTHWEGFPLSLVEAMQVGLPVVATDCSYGPDEILEDGQHGLLSPPRRPDILASQLEILLSDEHAWHRYAAASLERAKDFSSEIMLSKYRKMILKYV